MTIRRSALIIGTAAGLATLFTGTAHAQPPAGFDCTRVVSSAPTPGFSVASDCDLVVLEIDDGSQVQFADVPAGSFLSAPDGLLVIGAHKCVETLTPELSPSPSPEPAPTPTSPPVEVTPTPVPQEPSPVPTAQETSTPTPTTSPTTTPATPTPEVEVLGPTPRATEPEVPAPTAEVRGRQQLADTGRESAPLAIAGLSLLSAGSILVLAGQRRSRSA